MLTIQELHKQLANDNQEIEFAKLRIAGAIFTKVLTEIRIEQHPSRFATARKDVKFDTGKVKGLPRQFKEIKRRKPTKLATVVEISDAEFV